jgi:hypothetical protein
VDNFSYQNVFAVIQFNYKENIILLPQYQHFLNGLIVAVMRYRKYILTLYETELVLGFISYILKTGYKTIQSASPLTLQCLTNITHNELNHSILFKSKIPLHLFNYIQETAHMTTEGYIYGLTAFINLTS